MAEDNEEKIVGGVGENHTQQQDMDVAIDKVKMAEHEEIRIIITKTTDNEVSIMVKTNEGKIEHVSFFEVIGLLETAKSDMLAQNGTQSPQQGAPMMMVPVTLEAEDFELDADGRLAASGKKIGDMIQVPAPIAELRENAIANLRRQKNADGPTHMSIVPSSNDNSEEAPE